MLSTVQLVQICIFLIYDFLNKKINELLKLCLDRYQRRTTTVDPTLLTHTCHTTNCDRVMSVFKIFKCYFKMLECHFKILDCASNDFVEP